MTLVTVIFLLSFAAMSLFHWLGIEMWLYWRYEWYDLPMHFLGGCVSGLGFYAFLQLGWLPEWMAKRWWPLAVFLLAIVIGWELFEYFIVQIPIEANYWQDTISDIILGLLGGVVGAVVARSSNELEV